MQSCAERVITRVLAGGLWLVLIGSVAWGVLSLS
jgi:hypothetical protein